MGIDAVARDPRAMVIRLKPVFPALFCGGYAAFIALLAVAGLIEGSASAGYYVLLLALALPALAAWWHQTYFYRLEVSDNELIQHRLFGLATKRIRVSDIRSVRFDRGGMFNDIGRFMIAGLHVSIDLQFNMYRSSDLQALAAGLSSRNVHISRELLDALIASHEVHRS